MSSQSSPFISYSANREDVLLNRLFGERRTGFYIDVGAAHPMFENDTKALYDRGWSGINIEPNKSFFEVLAAERPRDRNLNIAISDSAGELLFFEVVGTGLSTCDPDEARRAQEKGFEIVEQLVKTQTLRDLLEAAQVPAIDLLKIDVEGFEPNVIRSNDWNRFRPNVIVAEVTFPETPVRRVDVIGPLLEKAGYRRVYFDGLNDYYLENAFAVPEGAFDTPPNVFDRFMPLAQVELSRERDFLRGECEALKQERANALSAISSLKAELNRYPYVEQDLVRAREELVAMRARTTELGIQMESIVNKYTYVEQDLVRAREELATMYNRMTDLSTQKEGLETERAAAQAWIEAIKDSTSWRITRPLRALAHPRRTFKILFGKKIS